MFQLDSHAEIFRWLRLVETDQWYREQCQIHWVQLRKLLGVQQTTMRLMRLRRDPFISEKNVEKMQRVIAGVESGCLVFIPPSPLVRNADNGRVIGRKPGFTTWLMPPRKGWEPQRSLVPDATWLYWSICRDCGGRKWMPVMLSGSPWVACYRCHPPRAWNTWLAKPRNVLLAERMVGDLVSGNGLRPADLELPEPTLRA